jgi:uncharacterized membrane protein YidH (DUF202 family)
VKLKLGDGTYYKHVDDLNFYDAPTRLAAEREQMAWLRGRLGK